MFDEHLCFKEGRSANLSETNCRDSLNLERQYTFSGIAIRSTSELPYERPVQP
jgi:hypothetical protein